MLNIITSATTIDAIPVMKKAGVSGIIFSVPYFSTRADHYFEIDQLPKIKKICEEHNIKMYTSILRIFTDEETQTIENHLKYLKQLDVDGIYFSDLGTLYLAQQLNMSEKMIFNPDTLLTNSEDVNLYLEEGCQMVTLAKEITLDEICNIAQKAKGEIEVIVHGRLNMFYSKRTLLSNYQEFREEERSLKDNYNLYLIEANRQDKFPVIEDDLGTHIFTGFTLASFNEVQQIVKNGVKNIRIEGIFKSTEEICETVKDYIAVLENKKNPQVLFEEYLAKDDSISTGFLHQKTIAKR